MALMEQWKEYASSFAQNRQQYERFWNQYFALEKGIYEKLLEEKEVVKGTVKDLAEKYGVKYLHRDFSPRFREGQDKARELGLYMQKYCGCIFSEEDRYKKKPKKPKAP